MHIKIGQKIIDIIRGKSRHNSRNENITNLIETYSMRLFYSYLPALKVHSETFLKYKSIYKGQDIVLTASGPTLKYYNRLQNLIHIGVNFNFTKENLDLDYLFVQDYLDEQMNSANNYRDDKCIKFYGYHYQEGGVRESDRENAKAERYYFIDQIPPTNYYAISSPDITTRPLNVWSSVIFAAMEFALWTHPKRIYLVGCDACANGHYYYTDMDPNVSFPPHNQQYGWSMIKKFTKNHYPDIEIVSVNPVALKGLFKDIYTKNYIEDNSELKKENIEILEF